MVTDDGGRIPAQCQDVSYPRDIQGLCGRVQQIYANSHTAPLAPFSGNLEEQRFPLKGVGRAWEEMTWWAGREEPHKLLGSTKSQKERVRPRAREDRHRLRQQQFDLRPRTADCGCVWTTELSTMLRNGYHLIWIKEGDKYKTAVRAVRAPSYAVWVDARTSYHITKQQYRSEPISHRQSNVTFKRGMTLPEPKSSSTMTLSEVLERRRSALNHTEVQRHPESGNKYTHRARIHVREQSPYAPSIWKMIWVPKEFTAKAHGQRKREQTKWSPRRWKEVERSTRS